MQRQRTVYDPGAAPASVSPAATILLIDDEPRILSFVARGLRADGYAVETASDGPAGLAMALSTSYDLVVLDLLLPGIDGTSVLERILQRKPAQKVIVLSALASPATKVRCLQLGAEDYLAKPFSMDELLARIWARLRKPSGSQDTSLTVGRLTLDMIRREADAGSGPAALAEREFLLLQELMRRSGSTVSKEQLLSSVWGYHFDCGSNVVDVYVGRLRRKLGADVVATVRGEGYRIGAL
jgi:two-component system, OmpR family, copper resistance phosphate regulon response regulator CusR